jgi:16S rRNA processing protein RimM
MPFVRVGWAVGPFGVRGQLKFAYTTDHPEWLGKRKSYLLSDPRTGECREITVHDLQVRGEDFLLRIEGFDTPEDLQPLKGWDIGYIAARGELPRENSGDVYIFELPGMEVRDEQGSIIGRVVDVMDSGAHTVLELDAPGSPLVPFIDRHFPEVNLKAGYLVTNYPFVDRV